MEIGAAELAVGDALEAHVFLELHDLGDGLVFHRAQLLGRDVALGLLFAGFQQVLGSQEAADMVETGGKLGHGMSPVMIWEDVKTWLGRVIEYRNS
jgi:hypothetical protein